MRTVKAMLAQHYGRFNIFQLMRLLQWAAPKGAMLRLDERRAPHKIRFQADLSAAFPGREISGLHIEDGVARLRTANFCIAGTLGPLPEPFTAWLREQLQRNHTATADFLDLFNQRLNILRFDLKADLLPELNSASPEHTEHAAYLDAIMGQGLPALVDQVDLPPRARLALAGMLANCRRSAAAVAHLLGVLFQTRVMLEQWVGSWQVIDPLDRSTLGRRNHALGRRMVLGRRTWDQQARVRLTIPGLDYRRACSLLPAEPHRPGASKAHRHLYAMVRLLLDRQCDCEVQLEVLPQTIPPARMSADPDRHSDFGLRLGQTAWLARAPAVPNARFLVPAYDTAALP